MARTWWPRWAAKLTRWVPMPPEAPKTVMFTEMNLQIVPVSTVLRLAATVLFSTELAQVRSHLGEASFHRDMQRRRVLARLAQHHPPLDTRQQRRGQHGG